MTTTTRVSTPSPPAVSVRARVLAPGRLLRLEIRNSTMLLLVPVALLLFWFDAYRRSMTFPPFWSLRTQTVQFGALLDFAPFVAGACAWVASRDRRTGSTDLVTSTPRSRWAAQVVTWAATTWWAVAGYACGVAAIYAVTSNQGAWGGAPWWPAVVGAVGVAMFATLGFVAGTFFPGRLTAPLAAVVSFGLVVVVYGAGYGIHGLTNKYALVSPVNGAPHLPDTGAFYSFSPDLSIVQVMFMAGLAVAALGVLGLSATSGGRTLRGVAAVVTAAGLVAAGTGLGLAGTTRATPAGLTVPAIHDAASDRLIPYTQVCGQATIQVCLHPAFRAYLANVTTAVAPVLREVTGLPGAPVRAEQVPVPLQSNGGGPGLGGPYQFAAIYGSTISGSPPVFHIMISHVPGMNKITTAEFIDSIRLTLVQSFIGIPNGAADQAQQAVQAALLNATGVPLSSQRTRDWSRLAEPGPAPGSPVYAAVQRLGALSPTALHAWLAAHLTALRAGTLPLGSLS
jgi:hypothetical protein